MLALIVMIVFGLLLTFFALENTNLVSMTVLNYTVQNIPLYMIVIGSVLFGLFVGWVMSLMDWVSTSLALRGKESTIKKANTTIGQLEDKVRQLEVENARLTVENKPMLIDHNEVFEKQQEEHHPNFFERLFHRPRFA